MAAAVGPQRQMAAAGRSRPGMINLGAARAFARVRKPGVLTFAAISEVGVGGRRVDGGHRFEFTNPTQDTCIVILYLGVS